MAIKVTDLIFDHSGGASNTLPANDLGGVISSATYHQIKSQQGTNPVNITGVTILDAFGNAEGVGSLSFTFSTGVLGWKPYGGVTYNGVNVATNGTYIIGSSNGYMVVSVVSASLPVTTMTDAITISNNYQNLFPHVSSQQSLIGRIDYRCVYINNTNAVDTAPDVRVWRQTDTSSDDYIEIGLDPIGLGDGVTTGVAPVIANGTTAPSGVTFSAPASFGSALVIGDMLPLKKIPLWIRRVVPVNTRGTVISNFAMLGLSITV